MRLYIDKENLLSLVESRAEDGFKVCANSIFNDLDVQYNFSTKEIESNELLRVWFEHVWQDFNGKQFFVPEDEPIVSPPRPLKSNFYTNQGENGYTSIYLLNDNHICEVIEQKSCVLIGKVGDEIRLINSLIMEGTETPSVDIESWQKYCPNLPLSDIIICDNHYFKKKETYEKNANELILTLASIPNESPVNVVIITKVSDVALNLSEEQRKIKELVKKASNSKKSTVTILTTKKAHDRCLITNYYRIKHGSCFHLKDSGIKEDVTTEIKSHIKRNNEKITKRLLTTFKKITQETSTHCYGDKVSNLISFS